MTHCAASDHLNKPASQVKLSGEGHRSTVLQVFATSLPAIEIIGDVSQGLGAYRILGSARTFRGTAPHFQVHLIKSLLTGQRQASKPQLLRSGDVLVMYDGRHDASCIKSSLSPDI